MTSDPEVCHGKPCIKGTRIMASLVIESLAEGSTTEEILANYPTLRPPDVQAALAYAAELAHEEDLIPLRPFSSAK